MPSVPEPTLKKIAFVAMPFRTKRTGLEPGKGPEQVNFDELWECAVKPALQQLGYMPLRADEQTGSVIVKDMLNALVHADLVLADISIANGNVYYEAGIRHAARESGCVLINADWARPLFDLKQITQIRYPLDSNTPTVEDYQKIQTVLVGAIPQFSNATGPVYELVRQIDDLEAAEAQLRERTAVLFEFDTQLNSARLNAGKGEKEPLRAMCSAQYLEQLPGFALKELIDAVRDNLNWTSLVSTVDGLPDSVRLDAHFQEQKALGLSMGGKLTEAIAILEEVVKRDGKSCLRLGNLGGMYRHLSVGGSTKDHTRYLHSAIQAFRDGMAIDLNDYYCSHKLLIMLVQRNRQSDAAEAAKVSALLHAACRRAADVNVQDEWLYPTLLIHAFYKKDAERAREYADRVLAQSWSNWKLMGLLTDLLSLMGISVDAELELLLHDAESEVGAAEFIGICREIQLLLPVSQELLMSRVLPLVDQPENEYRKVGSVEARLALEGEEITSITSAGEETSFCAGKRDVVVRNDTNAKELYIVRMEIFEQRYEIESALNNEFQAYEATGKSLAIQINHEITTYLGVGVTFFINPTWPAEQYVEEGDYFVCPLPWKNEIYRV